MKFLIRTTLAVLLALALPLIAGPEDCKVFPSFNLISKDASGTWHPVIALDGTNPLVVTKAGVVPSSIGWMRSNPMQAVNDQHYEIVQMKPTEDENGIKIWLQIKSSHALNDAYAVLTHRYGGENWIACKQASIPNLTGNPQSFTVWFNNKNVNKGEWEFHIYHAGKELYNAARTDLEQASPPQAFSVHLFRRSAAVGKGDAGPAPFYMPVNIPDKKLLPKGDGILKIEVTIASNGRIQDHVFKDKIKKDLEKQVSANIKEWLFFPRIKQGKAVEQKVVVPLQLR